LFTFYPYQSELKWSLDYDRDEDEQYDPVGDISSNGSYFESDIDENDDLDYWSNELRNLDKDEKGEEEDKKEEEEKMENDDDQEEDENVNEGEEMDEDYFESIEGDDDGCL
jgi:hypothetical protein